MRSLTDRERAVLAHVVLDPDKWWCDAQVFMPQYGSIFKKVARELFDKAAGGDEAAKTELAAATQLTDRDAVILEAQDAGETAGAKYAEDCLARKVARWSSIYEAAKALPNYKPRAERGAA